MKIEIKLASEIIIYIIATVFFLGVNCQYFLRSDHGIRKIRKIFQLVFVSPLMYLLISTLLRKGFFNQLQYLQDKYYFSLILQYVLDALFFIIIYLVILVGLVQCYSMIIGQRRSVAYFIYVMMMMIVMSNLFMEYNLLGDLVQVGLLLHWYVTLYKPVQQLCLHISDEDFRVLNTLPTFAFVVILCLNIPQYFFYNKLFYNLYGIYLAVVAIVFYFLVNITYRLLVDSIEQRRDLRIKMIENEKLNEMTLKSQEQVILAFAEISEAKSGQTGRHVKRVSEYCRVLAADMGYDEEEVELIRIASMMHDVGKLLINPEIVEKPDKLTDQEFTEMKKHVIIGENLLHKAPGKLMEYARIIAYEHHEKWDGTGYLGMKGEKIHLISRIAAVADVFDALVSKRSYKKAWTTDQAREIIMSESGTHFDPNVVQAFLDHFDEIVEVFHSFPEME